MSNGIWLLRKNAPRRGLRVCVAPARRQLKSAACEMQCGAVSRAFSLRRSALAVADRFNAGIRAEQAQGRAAAGEEPHRHDTGPCIDVRLACARVAEAQALHVEDFVAVVGDE